jgi:hypothetical protein
MKISIGSRGEAPYLHHVERHNKAALDNHLDKPLSRLMIERIIIEADRGRGIPSSPRILKMLDGLEKIMKLQA